MVMWQVLWLGGALLGLSLALWSERSTVSFIMGSILGTLVSGFAVGILILFAHTEGGSLTEENIESGQCAVFYTHENIASVERLSETTASFVLGTGNFRSDMYYYAYVERTDGWFLEKYKRKVTYIVEQDAAPKVVTTNWKCNKPLYSWLKGKNWIRNHFDRKHILHVPKNSIIREYRP